MQLQKGPVGVLGAFGLKVLGQNPQEFGNAVTPVVDVFDQYLALGELQITRQVMATALAASNSSTFTVPAAKVWRLIAASLFGAVNAADNAFTSVQSIALLSPNSTVFSVLIASSPVHPGGASPRAIAATFRPPIFLPSGWSVSLSLSTSAAITVTSNFQAGIVHQEFDQ